MFPMPSVVFSQPRLHRYKNREILSYSFFGLVLLQYECSSVPARYVALRVDHESSTVLDIVDKDAIHLVSM